MSNEKEQKDQVFGQEQIEISRPYDVEGYKQLDAYAGEDEGNQKAIQQLLAMGADLSNERHSVYYFYFPTAEAVERACVDLQQLHFLVSRGKRLEDEPPETQWPLTAERTGVVNLDVIQEWRSPLHDIAEKHGGVYDGWEAALD